jgi:hypothetical protein
MGGKDSLSMVGRFEGAYVKAPGEIQRQDTSVFCAISLHSYYEKQILNIAVQDFDIALSPQKFYVQKS